MSTETITLLNTVSRVPWAYEAGYAKRLLADPELGRVLVVWDGDSEKPEVLGQPRIDGAIVDNEGQPVRLPVKEVQAVVEAQAPAETAFGDAEVVGKKPAVKRSTATKKD
jgi:hypothetical protein